MLDSLPSREFAAKRYCVTQQYYRFVMGRMPSDYKEFDARLHIFKDGTAKLAEADGSGGKKACTWWEIILPNGEYFFYLLYDSENQD